MPREASDENTFGALSPYFGTVRNADCDHVPAPADHAPRLGAAVDEGAVGLRVRDPERVDEGAWIHAEHPWAVRQ